MFSFNISAILISLIKLKISVEKKKNFRNSNTGIITFILSLDIFSLMMATSIHEMF
jgi:hypothetical protein